VGSCAWRGSGEADSRLARRKVMMRYVELSVHVLFSILGWNLSHVQRAGRVCSPA
jgi:hypothetical protein